MAGLTKKLTGDVITVFNGNGFLSTHLIGRLGKSGAQIVVGYRGAKYEEEKVRVAGGLGQIYYSFYNLKDEKLLHDAMKYSNIVVNTIGKTNETANFTFEELYIEGARRMARVARESGVQKFIHVSGLNVSPNPKPWVLKNGSNWLRTKYYGELAVREEFPNAIIIRPSDMIGERDNFINHFTHKPRWLYSNNLYIWDFYDGVTKQPVYVRDVAHAIENAIMDSSADGKTFQAVGPYTYHLYDLIDYVRKCAGLDGECMHIKNLRWGLHHQIVFTLVERFRKYPFITWDRIERDCTSDFVDPKLPTLKDLGVEPTPLEELIKMFCYYRPRYHRNEIAFEAAVRIEQPKRLNELSLS